MLSSVEEIVLLQLDDTGTRTQFPLEAANVVLAGAVMMDLALQERIDTDLNLYRYVARLCSKGERLSNDIHPHAQRFQV